MHKIKILSLALISTLILTACFHKKQVTPLAPAEKSTLLWRVEMDGQTKAYLFGTMHIIAEKYYYFPENLKQLVLDADKVVLEIGEKPGLLEVMRLMQSSDGNIFDKMTSEQKDSVYTFIDKEMGKNPEKIAPRLGRMKPMLLQQFLASAAFPNNFESYEEDIYKLQSKAKAPYIGLETMEEQIALLDQAGTKENIESIMATIRDIEGARQEMMELSRLHREGDVEALYDMINGHPEMDGLNIDDLLFKRNANWIPKLIEIMDKENAFIAVGAGHLGGEKGLINLLEKAGYTLSPMNY
ncbi:hypothetical protein SAMN05216474_0489 [Lishizhenia tianjinensis]|uniref:TraB family protein n=1 Tax=Lishizhenia tianjinensis TaxID=477690 RepID=A0A1I6XW85_9FLAO|nr:TraB/GumN family protein [Lishizhenia tianjinensis]SFT42456.1 hypothetical protein SAMN05216474_0489 [Lishizhenia tianjinensis]